MLQFVICDIIFHCRMDDDDYRTESEVEIDSDHDDDDLDNELGQWLGCLENLQMVRFNIFCI